MRDNTGSEVILLVSREYQINMIDYYSEFFKADFQLDGNSSFSLNESADIQRLKDIFRWSLNNKLANALVSTEALSILEIE